MNDILNSTFGDNNDPRRTLLNGLAVGGAVWVLVLALIIGRAVPVRVAVVCPSGTILASRNCYPIQPGLFTFTFELTDHFVWPGTYRAEVEIKNGSIWIAGNDKFLAGQRYLVGERPTLNPNDGVWGGGTVQMKIF